MSNLAYARPSAAPQQQPRHIEIVATRAQRRARPKTIYAVTTIAALFLIFAAQLLLSIAVSEGQYQIASLQTQQKELLRTQDALSENLNILSSTQNLSMQAASRGMVPNVSPLAIDLSTGGVFGLPGSTDPVGCGGSCNLITNALLADVPMVTDAPVETTTLTGSTTGTTAPSTTAPAATVQTPPSSSLPAPVTR
jgi:hypothetical protein